MKLVCNHKVPHAHHTPYNPEPQVTGCTPRAHHTDPAKRNFPFRPISSGVIFSLQPPKLLRGVIGTQSTTLELLCRVI